jgi:hypothetical protein
MERSFFLHHQGDNRLGVATTPVEATLTNTTTTLCSCAGGCDPLLRAPGDKS